MFLAGCFFPALDAYAPDPDRALFRDLAQIGATFLIAYTVEITWLLKVSRARGSREENWVGFTGGVGCFGLSGIACALALSTQDGDFTILSELVACWSLASLGALGLLVAAGPFLVYDWAHFLRVEYPDE
jgi:hypothetical protein